MASLVQLGGVSRSQHAGLISVAVLLVAACSSSGDDAPTPVGALLHDSRANRPAAVARDLKTVCAAKPTAGIKSVPREPDEAAAYIGVVLGFCGPKLAYPLAAQLPKRQQP